MDQTDQKFYRADIVRAAIGARRLTNERLAEIAGLSSETISRARKGENLSVETLRKIADALDIEMADLFTPKPEAA